jgi:hypothetical protein
VFLPTVAPGYIITYDQCQTLLSRLTFNRMWCANPRKGRGEGWYGRIVHDPARQESCLQLILYYRVQWFPYHVNDFSPLYVYFTDDVNITRVIYDDGHHRATQVQGSYLKSFTVWAPWHSFQYGYRKAVIGRPLRSSFFPLTDEVLQSWWLLPGKPQFKLRSKFTDPWHPGLLTEPAGRKPTFRDEASCPHCGRIAHLDTMEREGHVFYLELRCLVGHRYTARYDALRQAMETA